MGRIPTLNFSGPQGDRDGMPGMPMGARLHGSPKGLRVD